MMDSRSRRLPFSMSGSRSSYTSPSALSSSSSSSSLGSSRLYSRDRVYASSDCFPRGSSALKPDLDHQSCRPLSSPRDYSSSNSRSPSWKLPSSLTSSTSSYERSRSELPLSSRSQLSDSERRLGTYSGLLNASDDGDSKRAKLSCSSSRAPYLRTPSTSVTGSTYSSTGLSSGTGTGENTPLTSRLLSRASSSSSSSSSTASSLLSRRDLETRHDSRLSALETRHDSRLSALGESRTRTSGLSSSLYQPDRVTSTYAQGARPKETVYSSSSSSSSTARESSQSRHLSSAPSYYRASPSAPLSRDFSSRSAARSVSSASNRTSPEQTASPSVSVISSSTSHISYWYNPPAARQETNPNPPPSPTATVPPPSQRPATDSAEPDGRSSTRRLLSRLFSRRSSQDSSSGSSSSAPSFESTDDSPPREAADSEEGPRTLTPDTRSVTPGDASFLRRSRLLLSPIQETTRQESRPRVGPARSGLNAWREPGSSSSSNSSSVSSGVGSWLSSSLRNRCPPLFSRHRREGRDESAHSASDFEDAYSHLPQSRRWAEPERKADEEEEEEEDDDGEVVGAVGVEVSGAAGDNVASPIFGNERSASSVRPRVRLYENILVALERTSGVESQSEGREKEKPLPSRDPERLRKIQESLMLEDSDEEEGDLCRICQMGEELASNPLIEPCSCTGSLQYVHQDCIKKWLLSKISSGTELEAITTCELCKEKLHLNIDNFDVNELYRTHVQSEYEFVSSGLYLVVLLHLCEQRFSDVLGAANEAGFFNLTRTLHEHMVNHDHVDMDMESHRGDTDEEDDVLVRDTRPSVEFSDDDMDLEDECLTD